MFSLGVSGEQGCVGLFRVIVPLLVWAPKELRGYTGAGRSAEGCAHHLCRVRSCLSTRVKLQCVSQPEQHRSGDVGLRCRFGHQLGYLQLYITSGTVGLHVWVLCWVPAWQRHSGNLCSEGREAPFYLSTYYGIVYYISVVTQDEDGTEESS